MYAGLIIGFIFVLVFLYVLGTSYYRPLLGLYNVLFKGALGAVLVYLFNLGSVLWQLEIPLNPFNSLVVGFMGLPGMVLLLLARYIIKI
ncbi:MAG TPA: pro-sigmaK processing inhibitor BofA family protein [Bacillota bacterium]|nr:pro-sigmaK processing inhibitor BofA family protein [Bacillota bacterium]